jgi:hypothetical protein
MSPPAVAIARNLVGLAIFAFQNCVAWFTGSINRYLNRGPFYLLMIAQIENKAF